MNNLKKEIIKMIENGIIDSLSVYSYEDGRVGIDITLKKVYESEVTVNFDIEEAEKKADEVTERLMYE
jgi:hypothetical protein